MVHNEHCSWLCLHYDQHTLLHSMEMVVTPTTIPVTELGLPLGAVRNTELSRYTANNSVVT